MRYLIAFILLELGARQYAFAAQKAPSLGPRERVAEVRLDFPDEYDFFINRIVSRDINEKIVRPFIFDSYVMINRRFSTIRYADMNIIVISYYRAIDDDTIKLDDAKLKSMDIVKVDEFPKKFGTPGRMFYLREITTDAKIDYMRWVAVIGNSVQTAVICGIFPSDLEQAVSAMVRRVVEYAIFVPIEGPNKDEDSKSMKAIDDASQSINPKSLNKK